MNTESVSAEVSDSFGRCAYFLIHDTETKENVFADNSAAQSSGGAGIKAAQVVVDSDVHVLLTPRCGQNAADVLTSADITLFKTLPGSAEFNIAAYVKGELAALDEISPGHHQG